MTTILDLRSRLSFKRSSSGLMALASIAASFFPLLRGVFLARLLTPEQFGISISGTVVMGVAELVSDIGLTQLAVKSNSADEIDTLHTLAAIRGLILFVVLTLSGPFLAWLFRSPDSLYIYPFVGAVIFMKGFGNLQIKLLTRDYNYLPEAMLSIGSQLAWTIGTIVAAFWLRNYTAMVIGLIVYAISYVVISHASANVAWRLRWDKAAVFHAISFGRPLVLNGVFYAIIGLGDRFLTGARVSLVALAHYTALTTSAFLPRSAVGAFLTALFLPHFVNAKPGAELRKMSNVWFIVVSLLAAMFGFTYLAIGQILTTTIFGHGYEAQQSLVSLVAILGTIRYVAILPTPPALAFSQGKLLLQFTMLSTIGLALGATLIFLRTSLELLVLGMSIGETLALVWLVAQLRKLLPVAPRLAMLSVLVPLTLTTGMAAFLYLLGPVSLVTQILLCLGGATASVGCGFGLLKLAGLEVRDLFAAMLPSSRTTEDHTPDLVYMGDDAAAESQ